MSLKTIFRWHLWFGLISGVCMFIVGLTGAVAVFAPEIDWLVIAPLRVKAPPNATPVDVETVIARVQAEYPKARLGSLHLSVRPSFAHSAALQIPRDGTTPARRIDAYVNPFTGEVQGHRLVGSGYFSSVYQFIRQTHVRLLMGLWGRVFVGVLGVSLVLSCITGLWIYRGWIKKMFTLRLGGSWGSRTPWAEMHKLIGVWSLLFNILIGATGAVLGIENLTAQIRNKWIRPAQARVAVTAPAAPAETPALRAAAPPAATLPVNMLLAKAKEAFPDLTPRVITFPARTGAPIAIRGDVPSMLVAQSHVRTANSITLHSDTGEVAKAADGRLLINDGRKTTGWTRIYWTFDPLHFGYFGGLPTKILWFILGLTPSVLALTGTWMWWRRRSRATKRGTGVPPVSVSDHGQDARATTRWITVTTIALTLIGAYMIVAQTFNNWTFTHRFAEFWLVKPISIALCAFPVTGLLAWLAIRYRARPWAYGTTCVLMGGWYLLLTKILM